MAKVDLTLTTIQSKGEGPDIYYNSVKINGPSANRLTMILRIIFPYHNSVKRLIILTLAKDIYNNCDNGSKTPPIIIKEWSCHLSINYKSYPPLKYESYPLFNYKSCPPLKCESLKLAVVVARTSKRGKLGASLEPQLVIIMIYNNKIMIMSLNCW